MQTSKFSRSSPIFRDCCFMTSPSSPEPSPERQSDPLPERRSDATHGNGSEAATRPYPTDPSAFDPAATDAAHQTPGAEDVAFGGNSSAAGLETGSGSGNRGSGSISGDGPFAGGPSLDSEVARRSSHGHRSTRREREKQLEEEKQRAAIESVRSQYEELAELAGSLAHEIKNPLSIIHMNIDLLSEDLMEMNHQVSRRSLTRVDMVRDQCERMEALLRDFLRYARLRNIDLLPGSLNDQVDQVLDAYQIQADSQHVDLERYLDPDLPTIRLHSDSLQSALMNLVKNALESMPDGGQMWARTYTNRGGVNLDLIDTGCGVDDNTVMHMFEPFYSTKDGGSGLGLPTARKIIEAHGGRISVQSELGRGTKFTLQFPVPPRLG